MNNSQFWIRFKNHFKNLNFYSMPVSILFIVRKRLNFVFFLILFVFFSIFTIF